MIKKIENEKLVDRFIDKKNGIEYIKIGDYYIPNLIDTASVKANELGKYGRMRLRYLTEHKKGEYTCLWLDNKLRTHLKEFDELADKRIKMLIKQLAKKENITEELKAQNQLEWVKCMNSIKNRAEEIVLKELIYM